MEVLLREIKTMDPINRNDVIDSEEFIYQVKWDGVRILAGIYGEKVILINKRGNERTEQFPELQTLPKLIGADNVVLDGEIVVLREGKPSFPAVIQRDHCTNSRNIAHLTVSLPLAYMVFDLLYLNGKDLRPAPLLERISQLDKLFHNQEYLHLVESFPAGTVLFDAVRKAGLEGIVAKRKSSRYSRGKQHSDWYKIKCLRTQNCLVGGYTLRGNKVNALLLGVFREGKLSFAGKAANGLSSEHLQMLSTELPNLEVSSSPFNEGTQPGHHYIKPQIGVLVEFLEWTDSLHLRFPVIKAFIQAAEADCGV